ncbi:hypothetical protein IW150_002884 [Coemansia sp. RSA 2607]|nr:hypothetical protein IW150_002884 [Coemansia sp. RSA 2607]
MSAKTDSSESALRAAVAQYTEYRDEYLALQTILESLPTETTYSALVPVGPLAFFPGHLIHTNEILVLLGDNYFAERSALQASQIALRRAQYADQKINIINGQLDAKTGIRGAGTVEQLSEDGVVEIKEEVQPGDNVFAEREAVPLVERVTDELEAKRLRAIRGEQVAATRSLDDEERLVLEMIERLVAEGDGDEEEDEEGEENEDDDDGDKDEEGDAFEHEDRANAARDDDEDDFNDRTSDEDEGEGDHPAKHSFISPVRENVVESPASQPTTPKGILKNNSTSTPSSLFLQRRTATSTPQASVDKSPARTVKFNPESVKPVVAQTPRASISRRAAAQQPMKQAVVERSVDDGYAPTLDSVDEDMHAREIAQAYNRMRFAKKDAWNLDCKDIADQVLENTPGVTLVDRIGSAVSEEGSPEEGARIELPPDPSPYNMVNMPQAPPQVVHQDPLPKPVSAEPTSKPKMSRFKAKRLGLD